MLVHHTHAPAPLPLSPSQLSPDRVRGAVMGGLGRRTAWIGFAFAAVVGVLTIRLATKLGTPGVPSLNLWGLADFRDAIYYPAVALLQGHNPYDAAHYLATYPVITQFPLYSPLTLLVHLPFALLPFPFAAGLYYVASLLLVVVLAHVTLRFAGCAAPADRTLGVATLLLLSRPGYQNLLLGQCTLQVVLGADMALVYARTRPWLAAVGLALTTLKPTFGLPLAALMLVRGDTTAAVRGLGIAAVLTAAVTTVLAHDAGGVAPLLASVWANDASFQAKDIVSAAASPLRIDAAALAAHLLDATPARLAELLIGLAVLTIGGVAVWRLDRRRPNDPLIRRLSTAVICITTLSSVYHQTYDLLLLALPVTTLLAIAPSANRVAAALRWSALVLLIVPVINYVTTWTVIERLTLSGSAWSAVTSINSAALLAGLLLCCGFSSQAQLRGDVDAE